ncbi:MAG: hypothetical protein KGH59_02810, partial [Candidatus Micrarchaeota archaeon]|nr:hypothetical protein [Candidatus Micrarchaeota archaeon]
MPKKTSKQEMEYGHMHMHHHHGGWIALRIISLLIGLAFLSFAYEQAPQIVAALVLVGIGFWFIFMPWRRRMGWGMRW